MNSSPLPFDQKGTERGQRFFAKSSRAIGSYLCQRAGWTRTHALMRGTHKTGLIHGSRKRSDQSLKWSFQQPVSQGRRCDESTLRPAAKGERASDSHGLLSEPSVPLPPPPTRRSGPGRHKPPPLEEYSHHSDCSASLDLCRQIELTCSSFLAGFILFLPAI